MEHIAVPQFNRKHNEHSRLAQLSRQCHTAATQDNAKKVAELEAEIDRAAARLWGITDDELLAIQDALTEMSPGKTEASAEDESDDE
jgi:hypothetical protein